MSAITGIRTLPTAASYWKAAIAFFSGLLMLSIALFARRAANYRGDVEKEIEAMAAASRREASALPNRGRTALRPQG